MSKKCPRCGASRSLSGNTWKCGTVFNYHNDEIQVEKQCFRNQLVQKEAENERLREVVEKNRWIPIGDEPLEVDGMYECVVEHFHTKGVRPAHLFNVDESDVNWRTVDDNSELSHDWDVTHYREVHLPIKTAAKEGAK